MYLCACACECGWLSLSVWTSAFPKYGCVLKSSQDHTPLQYCHFTLTSTFFLSIALTTSPTWDPCSCSNCSSSRRRRTLALSSFRWASSLRTFWVFSDKECWWGLIRTFRYSIIYSLLGGHVSRMQCMVMEHGKELPRTWKTYWHFQIKHINRPQLEK